MKISSIKISNVLSFKHYKDFAQCKKINFNAKDNKSNLQILIGPNGSGKSNFLEILDQLFKNVLFKRCVNSKLVETDNTVEFERNKKNVLTLENQNVENLHKNWHSKNSKQKIYLALLLNNNDFQNIDFVIDNCDQIDSYINEFSTIEIKFSSLIINKTKTIFKEQVKKSKKLNLVFSRNTQNINEKFQVSIENKNNATTFILWYLQYFELIKAVIEIHNANNKDKWKSLKTTHALIGCYRNYDAFTSIYPGTKHKTDAQHEVSNSYYQDTTLKSRGGNEPTAFQLVKNKLTYQGVDFQRGKDGGDENAVAELYKTDLYKNINTLLNKYLHLKLVIEMPSDPPLTFKYLFQHNKGKYTRAIEVKDLSAGQKGMIHLIFALYGYEIQNGLLIIDEPELHLHPQLQRQFLEIIKKESRKRDIQIIIATHSPIFVTKDTINNVQRFYFDEEEATSKTISPEATEEEKLLIKILNHTNSTNLFFVNKAILVEGETDHYFFDFYIDYLSKKNNDKEIKNYELFDIQGKGSRKNWTTFLENWGLVVHFIGDWDNIKDTYLFSDERTQEIIDQNYEETLKRSSIDIQKKGSLNGKKIIELLKDYTQKPNIENLNKIKKFILYLEDRNAPYDNAIRQLQSNPEKKEEIDNVIEKKYDDKIYILKNGELENYLGISKGLVAVIDFCKEFDASKINNIHEIDEIIINHIFRDNKTKDPTSVSPATNLGILQSGSGSRTRTHAAIKSQ